MAHLHHFTVPPGLAPEGTVLLSPEESHHALRVVRLREGDTVALLDGRGREYSGRARIAGKREVAVDIETMREEPPPAPRLTLAVAALHREPALESIVRHATELGVNRVVLFQAVRSERPPRLAAKLERIAFEALKQCGRLWLPELAVSGDVEEVCAEAAGEQLFLATADLPPHPVHSARLDTPATILVGPEGDFTVEERDAALAAGAMPFSLGAAVFRTEVAAIFAATILRYEQGGLGPR